MTPDVPSAAPVQGITTASAKPTVATPPSYTSAELLNGGREAVIIHGGDLYRLRPTARGGLILTK